MFHIDREVGTVWVSADKSWHYSFSMNESVSYFRGSSYTECLRSVQTSGYDGEEMSFHL